MSLLSLPLLLFHEHTRCCRRCSFIATSRRTPVVHSTRAGKQRKRGVCMTEHRQNDRGAGAGSSKIHHLSDLPRFYFSVLHTVLQGTACASFAHGHRYSKQKHVTISPPLLCQYVLTNNNVRVKAFESALIYSKQLTRTCLDRSRTFVVRTSYK